MIAFWCNIILCAIVLAQFAAIAYVCDRLLAARARVEQLESSGRVTKALTTAEAEEIACYFDSLHDLLPDDSDDDSPFTYEAGDRDRVAHFRDLFRQHAL